MDSQYHGLLRRARDTAFECFATKEIFERRLGRLERKTRALDFVAFAVPVTLGVAALAFWPLPEWAVVAAGAALGGQVVFATWALVSNWTQQLSTASKSAAANAHLSIRFQRLAKSPPDTLAELEQRLLLLEAESDHRVGADTQAVLTEREKRRAHRAALRQFQEACPSCNQIPYDMASTDCGVCGQFKIRLRRMKFAKVVDNGQ